MIFAFLVSFLSFAHVNMIGELYLSELLFAVYLVFSANKLVFLSEPFPKKILLLGFLWLLSQIVTDLYRDSSLENYLRGWFAIIVFLVDFCAVYIMVRQKPSLLRIIILGNALGTRNNWGQSKLKFLLYCLCLSISISGKINGKIVPRVSNRNASACDSTWQ